MTRVILAVLIALPLGCTGVPIQPTYTQQELRATCDRQGGRWHPDGLIGGYCEQPGRL
jgi:hypothetical protein